MARPLPADLEDLQVVDNPERRRFEVRRGRKVLGWSAYDETAELIVFNHTEVDPRWEGRGIGSVLVRTTLDHVRAQGMRVLPLCPFVGAWIARHPEYADLVYHPVKGAPIP
ncbi:MAG: GNAT family N-acetyltransferase [Actinomycetes bacterium]